MEKLRMKEPINKITLKDGSVRYRLVVNIGRDERGRRKQLTRTFDTRREAREELSYRASGMRPIWEHTSSRPRRR
jgi:hypothetical protein